MNEEETKSALKQAIKEWLDEQFAKFGRWTFYGLAAAGLAALTYLIMAANGWHK